MERQTLNFTSSLASSRGGRVAFPNDLEEIAPEKLNGYPSLRKAAQIVKVDPATLSRRDDVKARAIPRGRELLIAPDLALELAAHYRKRRLSAVASDLLDLALEHAPEYVGEIEDEIDAALDRQRRPMAMPDREAFLREAKRALPSALYGQVASVYNAQIPLSSGSECLGDDED